MRPEDTELASGENEIANELPPAVGVGRDKEDDRAMVVYFKRELTDPELRLLHEMLAGRVSAPAERLPSKIEGHSETRWDMGPEGMSVTLYFTTPDAMDAFYKRVSMNKGE